MRRTHTCGELREKDVGKRVGLYGWVHRRRDHGKLIFIDLRDRFGITQVVFNPKLQSHAYEKAKSLASEYVVWIEGELNKRPPGTINPKLPTGEVEVNALNLELVNPSLLPPFELEGDIEPSEELRLIYRYLDLRRPKVAQKFFLRHKVYKLIRDFLDEEGFVELETPFLTKSTPEGARDFLVPSRLNAGEFYALPQSPQLFKQILMVSGFERYFQIVRCFRDEDLRADRQPEFTQLDLEMSFIQEEDIFSLLERLIQRIFKKIRGEDLRIPFSHISYQEAMKRYGTDKPPGGFFWVVDFPLFKYNEEEKRWDSEHHPFTAPKDEDISLLDTSPHKVRARSYDLVLGGMEMGSGSLRIYKKEIQEKMFSLLGILPQEAKERFGFLLDALSFGAPPHGGFALGMDRFIANLAGCESIREVIAFPKTQGGRCLLTGAPSVVKERQLKELGLKGGRDVKNPKR